MYFRQSLKRPRQDFQQLSDFAKKQEFMKESVKQIRESQNRRIDTGLLQQIDEDYFYSTPDIACSPLLHRTASYPDQIEQLRKGPARQRDIGYYNGLFWIFKDSNLKAWTLKPNEEQTAQLSIQQQWEFVFKEDIMCVTVGKNGNLFAGKLDVYLVVVALLSEIKLYSFDGINIEPLSVSFFVGEQIQKMLISTNGDIFYAGSNGSVRQLRFYKKHVSISYKQYSGFNFKLAFFNAFNFFQPKNKAKQLIIHEPTAKIYLLVQKVYPQSWIRRKLVVDSSLVENKIIIFTLAANQIQYSHQITQKRIFSKLVFTNPLLLRQSTEITNIYVTKRGMLGVVFKSGMFTTIKNTQALEFYGIYLPPEVPQGRINLFQKLLPTMINNLEVKVSLGLDNLSCFNKAIVFLGPKQFDFFERDSTKDYGRLFEWYRYDILSRLKGTLFEEQPEWIHLHTEGVDFIKQFRNTDKMLIFIHVYFSLKGNSKADNNIQKLIKDLANTIGCVNFCSCLIELICNKDLETQMSNQIQEMLSCTLAQTQFAYTEQTYIRKAFLKKKVKISNSIQKIDFAKIILSNFESLPVKSAKPPEINIFALNLSLANPPQADALWYSIIFYFNSLFDLIKNEQASFFHKQGAFVSFISRKFQSFLSFLLEKMKFCSNFIRAYPIIQPQKPKQPEPMIIEDAFREEDIKKPPNSERKEVNDYPLNVTPALISKMIKLVQDVIMIIDLMSRVGYFEPIPQLQPTPFRLLINDNTRSLMRKRIFFTFQLSDPFLIELQRVFPTLISKEDRIFQMWLKADNKNSIDLKTILGVLDGDRLKQVKEVYFKAGIYKPYYDLLWKRQQYLRHQASILKDLCDENIRMRRLNHEQGPNFFQKSESEQLQRRVVASAEAQKNELASARNEFNNLLQKIQDKRLPEDFKQLDEAIAAFMNCQEAGLLKEVFELLASYMMIPQLRVLRAHPLVKDLKVEKVQGGITGQ